MLNAPTLPRAENIRRDVFIMTSELLSHYQQLGSAVSPQVAHTVSHLLYTQIIRAEKSTLKVYHSVLS